MGSTEATMKLAEYVEASVASVSRDGVVTRRQAAIQEENLVDFYVNGTLTVRFGCTASHVAELAAGHFFDMVSKAIRAGIPILVSKSVATDRGIELAREYGLTLICEARPFQFDIVSG